MDNKVIQRIDGALKLIKGIQDKIDGISFKNFIKDQSLIDGASFRIMQLGEKMIKLEDILSEKYPELPWKQARRMRNIIVHDYDNANPKIIYDTITKDMETLRIGFLKIKDDIKQISENSLKTERLLLRPWDDTDAVDLYELANNKEVARWCGWEPHQSIRDTMFALHNFLEVKETYAVCLKDSGQLVGSIGLSFDTTIIKNNNECELGFWIGQEYQRNGYAFEAANEIIRHAFNDLGMKTIWCSYFDGNIKSKNLQEKLGFKYCYTCKRSNRATAQEEQICYVNSLTKEK